LRAFFTGRGLAQKPLRFCILDPDRFCEASYDEQAKSD
jgi:hypothetical protein